MRSGIPPGPIEGKPVVDPRGRRVGVVESLDVEGLAIAALEVRLKNGTRAHVPRTFIGDASGREIILARELKDIPGSRQPYRP
ncbi:MAG TPA: hypothetical protein VM889_13850 [Candidatus Thermoplasmatota archaeon]|nr:hypothetical protein [Candidatus Thermoplasmatota archaeon]